ncbi:helix-turn-helix domain-containing protein [Mycolicibacterium komossense]|uniref:Helix-turn-helix domain-containing protein n=1 Tax=Mycolicibacterium komossense TaxID=1779 RepID=A0ABT3CF26_9MYCO|nr:helix-turn-helix domain-containing protein [Mycolicibacterium komossense]MCV7228104.1 helix-turn-helix domain-containing protein [Mycolicibacterium komossense]
MTRRSEEYEGPGAGGANAQFAIPVLDELLCGMYWGENICWRLDERAGAGPAFTAAMVSALGRSASFDQVYAIATVSGPMSLASVCHVSPAAESSAVVATLRRATESGQRALVVVDLEEVRKLRAGNDFESFVAEIAHAALTNGFIAHWFGTAAEELAGIESLAQCVVDVRTGNLRVARADGRGTHTRGAQLPFTIDTGQIVVEPPSVTSLLGNGLRAIRRERGWSQSQLGELIGISGSAISQTERGQHALSLETIVELTDKLGVSIDQLLRGRTPSYELARATEPGHRAAGGPTRFLINDPTLRLSTILARIAPRGAASPSIDPLATQVLLVGQGLVQVILSSDRPILRQGDGLLVRSGGIISCRNLGTDEAIVFIHEHN